MSDGFVEIASKSSAVRILLGFLLLFVVWTSYLLLFAPYLGVNQYLSNILPFLNLPVGGVLGINAINNFLALEVTMVGGAFALLFTGIIFFLIVLPAFQREGSQYAF